MEFGLRHVVGGGGLAVLGLAGVWLFLNATALRDESTRMPRPYSLSRVQLAWWTLVVLGAYLGVYAWKGELWPLNGTCLALLGVGGGTSVAGRIIDTRQQQALLVRHQDAEPSQGLFSDILSDENGISVHRFQTVAFNLAYGVSFIVSTFEQAGATMFPTFDSTTLLLLGLSSSVYIAVKPNETNSVPALLAQPGVASSSAAEATSVPSAPAPAESGPVAARAS
jgi:hypothetical protein